MPDNRLSVFFVVTINLYLTVGYAQHAPYGAPGQFGQPYRYPMPGYGMPGYGFPPAYPHGYPFDPYGR